MSSPTSFLSSEHMQQLTHICVGFLKEKHQLQIPPQHVANAVEDVAKVVAGPGLHPDQADIAQWNKRIILAVRDRFLLMRRTPPTRQVETPSPPSPAKPSTVYDVPLATKTEDTEEDFFKKLQSLELARKAPVISTPPTASTVPAPAPAPAPAPSVSTPLTVSSSAPLSTQPPVQPSPQPITVIVPSVEVANHGIVTRIQSQKRDWMYQDDIQVCVWKGPLPRQADETNCRVVLLMLPKHVLSWTPIVILRIEGAGGQHQDVYMTPSAVSASASPSPWVSYTPCSQSMSYVKRFALPWTIRVLDSSEEELLIGKDGWLVEDIDRSRLTLSHATEDDVRRMMDVGDQILIQDAHGKACKGKITGIPHASEISVEWIGPRPNTGTFQAPIYCMNLQRQWTLLMESQETSHVLSSQKK